MNPYLNVNNAYKQSSVTTLDQGTLIVMLYDGAIRFLKKAEGQINKDQNEGSHKSIVKAKSIVSELMGSLNVTDTGELGSNLQSIYKYMYDQLIDANVNKDILKLNEVKNLLMQLRQGWSEIGKKSNKIQFRPNRAESKSINISG